MFWTYALVGLFFLFNLFYCESYEIPAVQFHVNRYGFEAWIPDSPNVTFFAFHGRLNEKLGIGELGEFSGEVRRAKEGKWTYKKEHLDLKIGDVINFWVFVTNGNVGYSLDSTQYTISEFNTCENSKTTVNGSNVCTATVILEDDFNGNDLDRNKWNIDHLIPANSQNYEFVSYQDNKCILNVSGGKLTIRPNPHTKENDIRGLLDIRQGCTGSENECLQQQYFYQILPPIISGRIHSRKRFRYGKIEVRAKLPAGDWIYPQLRLTNSVQFAEIWIAYARGNKILIGDSQNDDIGASLLFGGVAKSPEEPERSELLRSLRNKHGNLWTDDFHNYTALWEPHGLTLFVDGTEYGKVKQSEYKNLFFYDMSLTLGVGIGGINDFPDGYVSALGITKPWINKEVKQVRKFFDARNHWLATWSNNSQLEIDFVKIYSL